MTEPDFSEFFVALRNGDSQAATEMVRRLEPYLRAVVRLRLTDPRLRRVLDSLDICRAVLGDFFLQTVKMQTRLGSPEELRRLLVRMVYNKVVDKQRQLSRLPEAIPEGYDAIDDVPSPLQTAILREDVQAISERLSPKERAVAGLRFQGYSWEEIAHKMGGDPDALRLRLARALARVRAELSKKENEPQKGAKDAKRKENE